MHLCRYTLTFLHVYTYFLSKSKVSVPRRFMYFT